MAVSPNLIDNPDKVRGMKRAWGFVAVFVVVDDDFPRSQKKVKNMHGFWYQTGIQAPDPPTASGTGHLSQTLVCSSE